MRPLSHSSISTYQECPQKWKFKYVDKIPEKPKSFFSFGKSVHSALEFFYNVPALPAPSLEQVLADYKERWIREGYKDAAQEAEYYADGEGILKEFYARHIAAFRPPFFAEYKFEIQVDGIPVIGFVDRIDKVGKDKIAIVDYKTGKSFKEDRVKTDAQLTMYQMACEELLGLKVDSLTFYHLNSQTPVTAAPHSAEQVDELRGRVVKVAGAILQRRFDPQPEERKCSWCDFKPLCPVFRDSFESLPPMEAEAVADPGGELASMIDRYGALQEQAAGLQAEAEDLAKAISQALSGKGWVRAFGSRYEAVLTAEERWEFQEKAKVLDLIRKSGRYEDILAPSSTLVQKLMQDPSLPPDLRKRLEALGRKAGGPALRLKKIDETPSAVA